MKHKLARGFTLVEIAIVLMIIGLLIGGILRGQELITASRVRNVIAQKEAVVSAYLGFLDRYRFMPGDLTTEQALIVGNGAAGGNYGGDFFMVLWNDSLLFFQNITAAGFYSCSNCTGLPPGSGTMGPGRSDANNSPISVYGGVLRFGLANGSNNTAHFPAESAPSGRNYHWYSATAESGQGSLPSNTNFGTVPTRMTYGHGAGIESQVMREIDIKIDDGFPHTGDYRFSDLDGNAGITTCLNATRTAWANPSASNCEGAWLVN